MLIRAEMPDDFDAIHDLTERAFRPMAFSSGTEADIIRALRAAGDLTLSLVAIGEEGAIVGHLAFSPVAIDGRHDGWFGLGPISVEPSRQRTGIGTAMMQEGFAQLKARGAAGCALVGNPKIYRSVGFESDGWLHYPEVDDRYVQRLVFRGAPPVGLLTFTPAFAA